MSKKVIDERTGMTEDEAEELLTKAPLFRKPESGPSIRLRNLNQTEAGDTAPHPAVEIGWKWTF